MNTNTKIAMAVVTGAVLGAAAMHGLHAQAKPPVFYVAEIDVSNPEAYAKEYASKARDIIKSHGGHFLAIGGAGGAGGKVTAFDGEAPKRAVVVQFDGMDKIEAWRNDPDYKELRKIGAKYATFRSFAIDGLPQ
jgi:uncharacterized protein (DUF1330 family)